jgi:hypothetical protein
MPKPENPQNAEINDWGKTVGAWCQRMSKSQLTLVVDDDEMQKQY